MIITPFTLFLLVLCYLLLPLSLPHLLVLLKGRAPHAEMGVVRLEVGLGRVGHFVHVVILVVGVGFEGGTGEGRGTRGVEDGNGAAGYRGLEHEEHVDCCC